MSTIEIMCAAIMALGIGGDKQWGEFACTQLEDIYAAAEENSIEPSLVISVIHHESRFRPHVVSRANACGLMQVVPKWTGNKQGGVNERTGVPTLTCKQLKVPKINIRYGTMTLKHWISSYGRGSIKVGLCGYNAGYRCKVTKDRKVPHAGGMRYSRSVEATARRLKQKFDRLKQSR